MKTATQVPSAAFWRCVRMAGILLAGLLGAGVEAADALRLPGLFQDCMVLQRDRPVPVWGLAAPGARVTVAFAGQTRTATADAAGRWRLALEPLAAAAEGREFVVQAEAPASAAAPAARVAFTNVLVGDVWLCSGQSNMAMPLRGARDAEAEIAAARDPALRLCTSPVVTAPDPVDSLRDSRLSWTVCAPETAQGFSATAFFFGRALRRELGVPIGLVHASLGGTPIQPWICRACMETSPAARASLRQYDAACADPDLPGQLARFQENERKKAAYQRAVPTHEPGPWTSLAFDDSAWDTLDTARPAAGDTACALLELRRVVDIPDAWRGRELTVAIRFHRPGGDATAVFLNGARAARRGDPSDALRMLFTVPGETVRPGKALLAVRNFARWYNARWQADFGRSDLAAAGADGRLPLAGAWRLRMVDRFVESPEPLHSGNRQRAPCGLFHGMIHPLIPFALKGAVWYQGESNSGNGRGYRELMPLLITCWRRHWGQGEFPFLITQLPNFRAPAAAPGGSSWAELREAQAMTAQHTPHCGIAVTIDLGEADDIHPRNKQDVGERLARVAQKVAYGRDLVHTGPTYRSMQAEDGRIRIAFDNAGSGLAARDGGPLRAFAVAGADQAFAWASAVISNHDVVVWSPAVKNPVAVRYAWADNPGDCNLVNREGLPAMPFRTDDWR